ncbi:MAG TPA: hypothetical protein VF534_35650, partial [Paraburkholderia sp.]
FPSYRDPIVVSGAKADGNGHVIVVYPGVKRLAGGYSFTTKDSKAVNIPAKRGIYIHYERHREHQRAVAQDHQDPGPFPDR